MLGPARFDHVETCAGEVCASFKRREELDECVASLSTLDDILADLRAELARLQVAGRKDGEEPSSEGASSTKAALFRKPDYSALIRDGDLLKAKRFLVAREQAVKGVRSLLAKKKAEAQ